MAATDNFARTWSDPSHKRIVQPEKLCFLDQREYVKQVGVTARSDLRNIYKTDFEGAHVADKDGTFALVLKAVKPSRIVMPTRQVKA